MCYNTYGVAVLVAYNPYICRRSHKMRSTKMSGNETCFVIVFATNLCNIIMLFVVELCTESYQSGELKELVDRAMLS